MATKKRLIDANELLTEVVKAQAMNEDPNKIVAKIIMLITDDPTEDAVEVVHGRWEPRQDVIGFVRCSVCHDCNIYDDWVDGKKWNYCPNCGAKMDGDGNA